MEVINASLYLSSSFNLSISTFVIADKERTDFETCQADIVGNKRSRKKVKSAHRDEYLFLL